MTSTLVQKLQGVRDLKKILETTVQELGTSYSCDVCQIVLSSPLDENSTAICEHRSSESHGTNGQSVYMPLVLPGRATGQLSLSRSQDLSPEEIESIRTILSELGEIVRHAQINDVVQRETFRNTFLVEIGNVMTYSLGIADALFMVVNILGKVLNSSRCLFVCTDDTQAGWRCYEYWQQNKVQSCQEYCWPTTDSALVAQTLLSTFPFIVYEGQENSFVAPVQEELQLLGVKSVLGVPLNADGTTHGCVIIQQCDYRRAWSRGEIDMVQNVADEVAKALIKLPAEKLVREPIMQLHQRIVPASAATDQTDIQSVRRALKGALGLQAIPIAQKTTVPTKPAKPVAAVAPIKEAEPLKQVQAQPQVPPPIAEIPLPPATVEPQVAQTAAPQIEIDVADASAPIKGKRAKSLGNILGGDKKGTAPILDFEPAAEVEAAPSTQPEPIAQPPIAESPAVPPLALQEQKSQLENIPTPGNAAAPAGQWGDLDSIPTPMAGPAKVGLSTAILSKSKAPQGSASSLMAAFHRDKSKFVEPEPVKTEYVEGPPIEIDDAAAEARIKQILSSSDSSSDYIFATGGVDTRVLGRIDGWVAEIEEKDKFANGHARPVAEYSIAIARQLGLTQQDIDAVRLAALVHDVGKLGASTQLLQKSDEELTDTELLLVMKHPIDGAELLESFPDLKHLVPIVRAHHEEWDGNGYPDGLKGEEIPMLARIISVANSYHLMTSQLKSGPAMMNATDAQQALTKGAGTQWDPRVVEALILALMQQKVPATFS